MEVLPHPTPDVPPSSDTSPFPSFLHPSPEACEEARNALASLHGHAVTLRLGTNATGDMLDSGSSRTVLDSLVRTILSQNTTDSTSLRAYLSLKEAFPTWSAVLASPNEPIEDAIRVGGLAEIKVARIKTILQTLVDERGEPPSLEYCRALSDEDAKSQLLRFKGVGPKTVSCVLLFCLSRDDFPVDTHVLHIGKRLGWLPQSAGREAAYDHLNARVPGHLKYDLHVLLVEHGKRCTSCAKGGRLLKPEDGKCPLRHVHQQRYMQHGANEEQAVEEPSVPKGKGEAGHGDEGAGGKRARGMKAGTEAQGSKGRKVKDEKVKTEQEAGEGQRGQKRKAKTEEEEKTLVGTAKDGVRKRSRNVKVSNDVKLVKQQNEGTPKKTGGHEAKEEASQSGSPGKWVARLQQAANDSPPKRASARLRK